MDRQTYLTILRSGLSVALDTSRAYVLAAMPEDRAMFQFGLTLLLTAESTLTAEQVAAMQSTPAAAVFGRPVFDARGRAIDVTVADYKRLMLLYAQSCAKIDALHTASGA